MNINEIEKKALAFAESKERAGCAYFSGLYRGYIAGYEASQSTSLKSVCPRCGSELKSQHNDKSIIKMAEKYAKEQCEYVTDKLTYTPSEIYHLVKMVWIDGYNKKTDGGN